MLANSNLAADLDIAREYGRIVIVGCRGPIEINPRLIMTSETVVTGVMLGKTTEDQWIEMGRDLVEAIEDQTVDPVIDQEFPLENAAQVR